MSKFDIDMAQEQDNKKSSEDCPYCGGVRVIVDKNQVPANVLKELEEFVSVDFLSTLKLKWSYCNNCKDYHLLSRC